MNRINLAVARTNDAIEATAKSEAELDKLNRSLDVTLSEYVAFQEAKSLAQASGALTFEESVSVYAILGSGPAEFNARTIAEKVTVTKLIHELLSARRAARVGA